LATRKDEAASGGLDPSRAVSIGRVSSAHGVRGEIKVQPLTDFPERFDAGESFWLDGQQYVIKTSRWQKNVVVIKVDGIDDRDAVEALRGHELQTPEPEALPQDAGVYYQHDIIGLRVEGMDGEALGKVADVLSTGANDVFVVRGPRGEILLPAVEDVVRQVDIANGRMVVELLPGLEFTSTVRKPRTPRPSGEERRLSGEAN
jgi:16S rRNA processing protein RimM